ncbi:MAG: hypothetical protein AAFU79_11790 [Myxococcota bacterium]
MVPRIRLGELLVKAGVLDELRLRSALVEQRKWGGRLGKVLVDLGYVEEQTLKKALSKQLGIPRANLDAPSVPNELLKRLDVGTAQTQGWCPERYDPQRKVLIVATVDPTDVRALDDIAFRTGCRVEPSLAGENEVNVGVERVFFGREPSSVSIENEPLSFRAMSGTEVGPFSEIDPSRINGEATDEVDRLSVTGGGRFDVPTAPVGSALPSVTQVPATSGPARMDVARKLELAQKRQNRAIRVMIDLLIERGVFTEDELRSRLGVRSKR